MTIAIDFDGTIVEHRYPKIGNEIPFATDTLKMLMKDHHRLILWTVREGELLKEAVEWCRERGVEFYAINRDYPEEDAAHHGFSRKVKADRRPARLGRYIPHDSEETDIRGVISQYG